MKNNNISDAMLINFHRLFKIFKIFNISEICGNFRSIYDLQVNPQYVGEIGSFNIENAVDMSKN